MLAYQLIAQEVYAHHGMADKQSEYAAQAKQTENQLRGFTKENFQVLMDILIAFAAIIVLVIILLLIGRRNRKKWGPSTRARGNSFRSSSFLGSSFNSFDSNDSSSSSGSDSFGGGDSGGGGASGGW